MPKPALVTVPAVEVCKVGAWPAVTDTGDPWVITPDDIVSAVAASRNPSWRAPVLKLGHADPRFTTGDGYFGRDGSPAVGRLTNLRASPDGTALLADLAGVPEWLAEVMPSAYPSRSAEALLGDVTAADGATYSMVITGLALLGETAPAIESLADVAALYGADTTIQTWTAARRVAATFTPEQPMPARTSKAAGSARLEDLYQAVEAFVSDHDTVPSQAWCREIYTDFVIVSDYDGRLWQINWTETGGEFTFTDVTRVETTYTPLSDTIAATAADTRGRPLHYVRGWDASAVTASQGDQLPSTAQTLREALGLAEDATDDQVLASVTELRKPVPPAPDSQKPEDTAVITPPVPVAVPVPSEVTPVPSGETGIPDAVAEQLAAARAGQDAMRVELTRVSAELAARRELEATTRREEVLQAAVSAGKIRPADKDRYARLYTADAAATVEVLAALSPGAAVPVAAAGYAGSESTSDDNALYEQWFPSISGGGSRG
jgi:hypothetical protein